MIRILVMIVWCWSLISCSNINPEKSEVNSNQTDYCSLNNEELAECNPNQLLEELQYKGLQFDFCLDKIITFFQVETGIISNAKFDSQFGYSYASSDDLKDDINRYKSYYN